MYTFMMGLNMRPEETIEKKFAEECEKIGIEAFKFEIKGKKGPPDRIVFLPGAKTFFFEFKRPDGGEVSFHQQEFIDWLLLLGFEVSVVDSWEAPLQIIKTYLKEYRNGNK